MKIAICGASGTGKTTLAKELEKAVKELVFVSTSAKEVWPKYGLDKHTDPHEMPIDVFRDYQNDILSRRKEVLSKHDSYITDRSPVDNIVYYLQGVAMRENSGISKLYIDKIEEQLKNLDLIIFLPLTQSIILEDDGKRVQNWYYQCMINSMFMNMLSNPGLWSLDPNIFVRTPVIWNTERDLGVKVRQVTEEIIRRFYHE